MGGKDDARESIKTARGSAATAELERRVWQLELTLGEKAVETEIAKNVVESELGWSARRDAPVCDARISGKRSGNRASDQPAELVPQYHDRLGECAIGAPR
jgi:hypothetical protein